MAEWSREKVESSDLNKGQEWTKNDQVALEELNAMVNSGLYAQDFVEKLVENIDISEIGNVGTPTVELIDGDGATTEKPYKKFKFSNFKGDKGDFGADYDSLSNKPIINADVSTLSVSSVVVNQIYRHTGTSTENLIKNKLYFSNGTEWVVYGDDGNSKVNFVDSLTTTTNLPQLNMNRLTEQELTDAKDKGTINANELYMTEDDDTMQSLSVYPIGTIYMNVNETSPAELFGGVWEQIKGRFLLASSDVYLLGDMGGYTDASLINHTHNLFVRTNPSNEVPIVGGDGDEIVGARLSYSGQKGAYIANTHEPRNADATGDIEYVSSGEGRNMPPYLVVNVWKRVE